MSQRYFNTSGPNNVSDHYTLLRPALVRYGIDLVKKDRYFTIWAPRQTGKSTYFLLLKKELEKKGYYVVHINFENFKEASRPKLMRQLQWEFEQVGITIPELQEFNDFSFFIKRLKDLKCVLIIDEIEGLNPALFGQFLHSLRSVYHFRAEHGLKSVILVGVSNIVGVVEDNASPFNIADTVNVPYFTVKETYQLLAQHETDTGQLFEEKVKAKISEITANQPGLVNGFAAALVDKQEGKKIINYEAYLEVENWFLNAHINKNIANIINKARPYRPFVEALLFRDAKIPFNIYRESTKELYVNGVIDKGENGDIVFKVPLYKKCLFEAFYPYMNGEGDRIRRDLWIEEFFKTDGKLNIDKLIISYKKYVQKRSFQYFREKDANGKYLSIKEAALGYSFETYITAFIDEAGGKSYLEAHTGLGRTDLVLNLNGQEYVLEFKIYSSFRKFVRGKQQLAYYCKKNEITAGTYLVFMANTVRQRPDVIEETEMIDGVAITTYLVLYDEEKDF